MATPFLIVTGRGKVIELQVFLPKVEHAVNNFYDGSSKPLSTASCRRAPRLNELATRAIMRASHSPWHDWDRGRWLAHLVVLRVTGDSMVDRQIDAGDEVIGRAQPGVAPRAVGMVGLDAEVTAKTIWHRRTGLWLKSEHEQHAYPSIRLRL